MRVDRPKLIFLVTEDWYFWTHRIDLAKAAQKAGFDVSVATRVQNHGPRIQAEGLRLLPLTLSRRSRQPLMELQSIAELVRLYDQERPTIVHHVAMKPILYGTIAARLCRVPVIVNAFAGLGYGFNDDEDGDRAIRWLLKLLLRKVLTYSKGVALCQNNEDRDTLAKLGIVDSRRSRVIRGAGVNLDAFSHRPEPEGIPIVVLASRMLWKKGVREFVEAAGILRNKGSQARFVLVGEPDGENPGNILRSQLREWADSGTVEWWGHRENMPEVIRQASIIVLPTYYREGLPKVLLEAGACGRPVIATTIPGCRDVVREGVNGLLIPPRSTEALAKAMERLLENRSLRETLGAQGRVIVEQEFSSESVAEQTLDLYRDLLGKEAPR